MKPPVHPGEVIGGRYRIEELLEFGGMGMVSRARDQKTGQLVALKMLLPGIAKDPELVARFRREARALATLRSQHVVRVLAIEEAPDGVPFIVLEYLVGKDLGRVLESQGPRSVAEAARYVMQACDAIGEAHFHHIVHRDIKPANLFLTANERGVPLVKVIDFGAARARFGSEAAHGEPSLTGTGLSLGTPGYMAPEQVRGEKVDARVDIWALGVTLYELIAGFPPFMGEDHEAMIAHVLRTQPEPLSTVRDDVPVELDAVIRRCLAKHKAKRLPSVEALAEAIEPFASG
jgi:serine/threonine protein kinase